MNAVAFSLWGSFPMYCQGAIRNSELMRQIYPGWKMVVYADDSVPKKTITELLKNGVEVRAPSIGNGMFWRFAASTGVGYDRVIFRDADSRISNREAKVVREWVESGKTAHIIADHPRHTPQIGGGLWGVKGDIISKLLSTIPPNEKSEINRNDIYNSDQVWLRDNVWPLIKDDVLIHDFCYHDRRVSAKPFPAKFGDWRFVGEVFDDANKPRSFDWEMRMNWMER